MSKMSDVEKEMLADDRGYTLLELLRSDQHKEAFEHLLAHKDAINVNIQSRLEGNTALMLMTKQASIFGDRDNNFPLIKQLFQAGADPEIKNNENKTALIIAKEEAIHPENDPVVKLIQEETARPTAQKQMTEAERIIAAEQALQADERGRQLITFLNNRRYAEANILLDEGRVNVNIRDDETLNTPLQIMIKQNTPLKTGDALNAHDQGLGFLYSRAYAPLVAPETREQTTAREGAMAAINKANSTWQGTKRFFTLAKKEISAMGQDIHTFATKKFETTRLTMIDKLLAAGANPDIPDRKGKTPLMNVCQEQTLTYGNTRQEIAQKLVDANADLNKQDHKGMTAIMHAKKSGFNDSLIKLLALEGADIKLRNKAGQTVYDVRMFNIDIEALPRGNKTLNKYAKPVQDLAKTVRESLTESDIAKDLHNLIAGYAGAILPTQNDKTYDPTIVKGVLSHVTGLPEKAEKGRQDVTGYLQAASISRRGIKHGWQDHINQADIEMVLTSAGKGSKLAAVMDNIETTSKTYPPSHVISTLARLSNMPESSKDGNDITTYLRENMKSRRGTDAGWEKNITQADIKTVLGRLDKQKELGRVIKSIDAESKPVVGKYTEAALNRPASHEQSR